MTLRRRLRLSAAAGGAVALATWSLGSAQAATPTTTPLPRSTNPLVRFSPTYMFNQTTISAAAAIKEATDYDLIAARPTTFRGYLPAMRLANPSMHIVAYVDGTFDISPTGSLYPASWYAHDIHGHRIKSLAFQSWLMDPTNPQWQATVGRLCTQALATSGYDGCFLDALGTAPLGAGYVTGTPINPVTHKVFTSTQWLTATAKIAMAVQAANRHSLVIPNGLGDGADYFASPTPSSVISNPIGDGMSEIWLRVAGSSPTAYRSPAAWRQDIDMIADAERADQTIEVTCKLWVNATAAERAAWHKYALASFLLAADGRSTFSFMTSPTFAGQADDQVAVGTPRGPYTTNGSVYTRSFTNGVVYVNEGSTPTTVTLSGPYTNFAGALVTRETLAPDSGDVFTR